LVSFYGFITFSTKYFVHKQFEKMVTNSCPW